MDLPFCSPDPVRIEMDLSVACYIATPLVMKAVVALVRMFFQRCYKGQRVRLTAERSEIVVWHLVKTCVYSAFSLMLLPLAYGFVGDQPNDSQPRLPGRPYSDGWGNYRHAIVGLSMVCGLYVLELVVVPRLSWATVVHHLAFLSGAVLLSGAVPCLSSSDLVVFLGAAINICFFQSTSFLCHAALAWYHMSSSTQVKVLLVQGGMLFAVVIGCFLRPLTTWAWLAWTLRHYTCWAVPVMALGLDATAFIESMHLVFVFNDLAPAEISIVIQRPKGEQDNSNTDSTADWDEEDGNGGKHVDEETCVTAEREADAGPFHLTPEPTEDSVAGSAITSVTVTVNTLLYSFQVEESFPMQVEEAFPLPEGPDSSEGTVAEEGDSALAPPHEDGEPTLHASLVVQFSRPSPPRPPSPAMGGRLRQSCEEL